MHVAMLAPPWIPVPPPGYGGIEEVVRLLCEGLTDAGHEVTLYAAPGSRSPAHVVAVLAEPHPDEIGCAGVEVDHVARAFAEAERAGADVVHDHNRWAGLAMADRLGVPMVHTVHGPFATREREFYAAHAHKAVLVCLSGHQRAAAPPVMRDARVVPNPLRIEEWPFRERKDDFALWVGRMCPEKGPHRAATAARAAGVPLILAGVVQPGFEAYFAEQVEPLIDGDAVRFIGEVGGERKRDLFARARALLMPIRWSEPFGLVMAEASACGTPVIAFPEGAAPELVRHGVSGFLVEDEAGMAAALGRVHEIDPADCRRQIEGCCGVPAVVAGYERAYEAAIRLTRGAAQALRHAMRSVRRPGYPDLFDAALQARQRLHADG